MHLYTHRIAVFFIICLHFSPSFGERLAFVGLDKEYWQVWVTEAHQSLASDTARGETRLTSEPFDKGKISWFPDKRHLLVNDNKGKVFVLDSQAPYTTRYLTLPIEGMMDAVIAPDGNRIAYSVSGSDSVGDNDIWLFDCSQRVNHKLTDLPALQHDPVFSHDQKAIYFLSGKGGQHHDIMKIELNNKHLTQLTSGQLYHFELSNDYHDHLFYSNNTSGHYQIYAWDKKSKPKQLTRFPAFNGQASVNHRYIAWTSSYKKGLQIWIAPRNALASAQILPSQSAQARLPVWPPEKKQQGTNKNHCLDVIAQ